MHLFWFSETLNTGLQHKQMQSEILFLWRNLGHESGRVQKHQCAFLLANSAMGPGRTIYISVQAVW